MTTNRDDDVKTLIDQRRVGEIKAIIDGRTRVFEVRTILHQRQPSGEDLFTSYYSLPFLAGLLPTSFL